MTTLPSLSLPPLPTLLLPEMSLTFHSHQPAFPTFNCRVGGITAPLDDTQRELSALAETTLSQF